MRAKRAKDQAIAHFPPRAATRSVAQVAWKHLGYKKLGGRWQKPEIVDVQKHEDEQQKRANKHWKTLLERWREGLASKDKRGMPQVAQQQLADDARAIDDYNATIRTGNDRVRQTLTDSVGIDLGQDRMAWQKWLIDLFGYASAPSSLSSQPPTIVQDVPIAYQPQSSPTIVDQRQVAQVVRLPVPPPVQLGGPGWGHSYCFGAGTSVRTLEGVSPIESLRLGDMVLSQNPRTGELRYRPVVVVLHNPPNATLRIELDHDAIVVTGIHRLWKAGQGWVMARAQGSRQLGARSAGRSRSSRSPRSGRNPSSTSKSPTGRASSWGHPECWPTTTAW